MASGPVFIFNAPGLIFNGTEGAWSGFHVLRYRTHFVPRSSGPFFMFSAPELIFDSIEGVWFRFHVLRDRTRFRRY
jgi:hypothetical protein